MKNDNNALSWICSFVTIFTSMTLEDVVRIVMLIVGCISAIVSLGYNVYCWYRKAKKDGKIDMDEAKELKDIVDSGIDSIKSLTDNNKEDKNNG